MGCVLDESGSDEAECLRKAASGRMDNLKGLLGIRIMDKVLNAQTKGEDERIDEDVLRWIGHMESMENDRIPNKVYVGECAGIRSVGSTQKG